jgi:hypothetical protein
MQQEPPDDRHKKNEMHYCVKNNGESYRADKNETMQEESTNERCNRRINITASERTRRPMT